MAAEPTRRAQSGRWVEISLVALIFAAAVLYLSLLPRNLDPADESVHLFDAKRLLHGAVMYRDVFNFITPGFMYLMASLFWAFGTDIDTARVSMAVIHGITAVFLYLTCRRMGVRRGWSCLPALTYVAVCQPAWQITSQHWLSTMLSVVALWLCAAPLHRPASTLWPGAVIGLMIGVQQQRGLVIAFGVFVWLVSAALLQSRREERPRLLVPQLLYLIAGALLVVIPLVAWLIARAGFEPVWQALVVFPMSNYREAIDCDWGSFNVMSALHARYTFPKLLKYLPLVLIVSAARLVYLWWRAERGEQARNLSLLLTFCLAGVLSIWYFPDFIHIAFIAPAFFVAIAESSEWALRRARLSSVVTGAVGWTVGLALLALFGAHLADNTRRLHETYSISRMTSFGRIYYGNPKEVELQDTLSELMADLTDRDLFVYPIMANLYLTMNAWNPTPYGFFAVWYGDEKIQLAIDRIAAAQPPFIVLFRGFAPKDDPIVGWIDRHYEPLTGHGEIGQAIYRRIGAAPAHAARFRDLSPLAFAGSADQYSADAPL
jgi:hypothetical protein